MTDNMPASWYAEYRRSVEPKADIEAPAPATPTPGPWVVEKTRHKLWIGTPQAGGGGIKEAVASVDCRRGDPTPAYRSRMEANAALIASAPEMAGEIARLKARIAELGDALRYLSRLQAGMVGEIIRLKARIAELEEALRPLARLPPGGILFSEDEWVQVPVYEIRRAIAALNRMG